jgi:2'-5' RNA ligase
MREPLGGDSALGVLLPEGIDKRIQRWRRRYDPCCSEIPAHITLIYPPFVAEEAWLAVRPDLAAVTSQFARFYVTLRSLGVFPGNPTVLWLRPEDDGSLARIHATLTERFPQLIVPLPFEYTPHVTVGSCASDMELAAAKQTVEAELKPMRFRVDRLSYMVLDSDGHWHVGDHLPLGRGQPRVRHSQGTDSR